MGIIEVVGVLKMEINRELPYPQPPKFWFGEKVTYVCSWSTAEDIVDCYWSEGSVTGINWNPEKLHWQYLVYWEENSDDSSLLGYNNDQLLISERDLQVAK
jgi:hypothetical protein